MIIIFIVLFSNAPPIFFSGGTTPEPCTNLAHPQHFFWLCHWSSCMVIRGGIYTKVRATQRGNPRCSPRCCGPSSDPHTDRIAALVRLPQTLNWQLSGSMLAGRTTLLTRVIQRMTPSRHSSSIQLAGRPIRQHDPHQRLDNKINHARIENLNNNKSNLISHNYDTHIIYIKKEVYVCVSDFCFRIILKCLSLCCSWAFARF